MYYYIFELSKELGGIKFLDRTKEILSDLGISGEIVVPTAARPAEELALMGIEKGYSSIVVVGSEKLVNRVASVLQNNLEVSMGIVPTNPKSSLHEIIGSKDLVSALKVLTEHSIKYINLGLIEPNKYFLNKAYVFAPKPTNINFQIDNSYRGAAIVTQAIISSDLTLELESETKQGVLSLIASSIKGSKPKLLKSKLKAQQKIEINTLRPLPVVSEREIIAQTPIKVTFKSQVLKIIVSRDRI